ncbi:hypothetical protein Tco_1178829 [Tanacetum coccineum]
MEIRKQWMTHGIDADMEYDPSNDDFADWIASKFSNHSNMDWYTKNALWMYWTRGDDEEVLTDKEISDLEETHVNEDDEVAEIFRIKTNIFDFKTPLYKDVPWVPKEPWSENGVPYEIIDHFCVPFRKDDELKNEALMKKAEFEESRDHCSFVVDPAGKINEEAIKDERKPMNDCGVSDLDIHLVSKYAPDYTNEEE